MKANLTVLLIFLFFQVKSQDIDKIIEDGLVLSYYLVSQDFDKIESYIVENGFKYIKKEDQTLFYEKNTGENEILSIYINLNNQNLSVAFSHDNEQTGSFFIKKIEKNILRYSKNSPLFYPFSESKDKNKSIDYWWFIYPKTKIEKDWEIKNGKQVKGYEDINYGCLIKIINGEMIAFCPLSFFNERILWDKMIPEALNEIR